MSVLSLGFPLWELSAKGEEPRDSPLLLQVLSSQRGSPLDKFMDMTCAPSCCFTTALQGVYSLRLTNSINNKQTETSSL